MCVCVCVCVCVKKPTVEGDGTPHHCGYGPAPLLNRRLSHTVYFYLGKLACIVIFIYFCVNMIRVNSYTVDCSSNTLVDIIVLRIC